MAQAGPGACSVPATAQQLRPAPRQRAQVSAGLLGGDDPGLRAGLPGAYGQTWFEAGVGAEQHPRRALREDVYTACQTAMKTARSQGSAAMNEVEEECQSFCGSYCQAATKPLQAQGVAASQEMEDERSETQQPGPGHDD